MLTCGSSCILPTQRKVKVGIISRWDFVFNMTYDRVVARIFGRGDIHQPSYIFTGQFLLVFVSLKVQSLPV